MCGNATLTIVVSSTWMTVAAMIASVRKMRDPLSAVAAGRASRKAPVVRASAITSSRSVRDRDGDGRGRADAQRMRGVGIVDAHAHRYALCDLHPVAVRV